MDANIKMIEIKEPKIISILLGFVALLALVFIGYRADNSEFLDGWIKYVKVSLIIYCLFMLFVKAVYYFKKR